MAFRGQALNNKQGMCVTWSISWLTWLLTKAVKENWRSSVLQHELYWCCIVLVRVSWNQFLLRTSQGLNSCDFCVSFSDLLSMAVVFFARGTLKQGRWLLNMLALSSAQCSLTKERSTMMARWVFLLFLSLVLLLLLFLVISLVLPFLSSYFVLFKQFTHKKTFDFFRRLLDALNFFCTVLSKNIHSLSLSSSNLLCLWTSTTTVHFQLQTFNF